LGACLDRSFGVGFLVAMDPSCPGNEKPRAGRGRSGASTESNLAQPAYSWVTNPHHDGAKPELRRTPTSVGQAQSESHPHQDGVQPELGRTPTRVGRAQSESHPHQRGANHGERTTPTEVGPYRCQSSDTPPPKWGSLIERKTPTRVGSRPAWFRSSGSRGGEKLPDKPPLGWGRLWRWPRVATD
jgi:hypothetical protein